MAAYLIAEVDVTDPIAYEDYKRLAQAAIAKHGGRYLVRGGAAELLEGGPAPKRLIVLEFQNLEAARRFHQSEDYAAAIRIRKTAATGRFVLVEGAP